MRKLEYDELFEDIKILENITPDYYSKTYPQKMENACKTYKVIVRSIASSAINQIIKFDDRDVIFIYPLERFMNMADILSKEYNLFTFGNIFSRSIYDRYSSAKVLSNNNLQKGIYNSFKTNNMKYAEGALTKLIKVLKKNKVKIIILGNDWTFFERLCAIAGREANIPVVTLQHGIYHRDTINIMEFGKYSDEFWCWSDYVKDCYEARYGEKGRFIKVVGYPHKIPEDCSFVDKNRVLFIGTPYRNEVKSLSKCYENVIENVITACRNTNHLFVYRPHPGEDFEYYKLRFSGYDNFKISDEPSITKDILKAGVVVGDTSSGLLETNLMHRRAIQIVWNRGMGLSFEDELYKTMIKTRDNINEISQAIDTNIGKYYEKAELFYYTGDPKIFSNSILSNVESLVK